jgi:uncharacterized protein (TIGR00288 family)
MAKPDDTPSMAVFCDFENVALGVRDAKYEKFDIRKVLERLLLKGSIVVKKAYCDWDRYREFKAPMHEASFELIEIPHVRQSGKNSADIRMVVDALDLCYTKSHVDTFVIVSGDSDFSPLVSKLRENAKTVIGVGVKGSTSDLLTANCDEFIFYDDLVREQRRRRAQREGGARGEAARGEARGESRGEATRSEARGEARGEAGRGAGRGGGGRGAGRGTEREALREPSRVATGETAEAPAAGLAADASTDASETVGGPWRPYRGDAGGAPPEGTVPAASPVDAAPEPVAATDAAAAAEPEAVPADGPKKRPPRRRKTAAPAAGGPTPESTPESTPDAAPDAAPAAAPDAATARRAGIEAPAAASPEAMGAAEPGAPDARAPRSDDERRQEAIDLALETVEALITERGADDKIWGSMVKQTLKRRRPGFAESYYGYRSFNELLEDARDRGLLALEHDEKSGGYVIRLF